MTDLLPLMIEIYGSPQIKSHGTLLVKALLMEVSYGLTSLKYIGMMSNLLSTRLAYCSRNTILPHVD